MFRLGLLFSCVSNYTVVCTDVPHVVNNINKILAVKRAGVVDRTDGIYLENSMGALREMTEEHSMLIFNVMDNTGDEMFCPLGLPRPLYRDRARCSSLQIKYPVATVWTMNDSDPCHKNKNHMRYQGIVDARSVYLRLTDCSHMICDYLSLTKTTCASAIASFIDFLIGTIVSSKKTLSSKFVAVFPNRAADAKRHRELSKYFEVKFVQKEAVEWFRIGEAYENEIHSSLLADSTLTGFNAQSLKDINAVDGLEFVVLYFRVEKHAGMMHLQRQSTGSGGGNDDDDDEDDEDSLEEEE